MLKARALPPDVGPREAITPPFNLLRIEEALSLAHIRLSRVLIECVPWSECIKRYDRPHTLFFCDPPYFETAGYNVDFGLDQYELLAETLSSIRGKFVLTLNDHSEMRRIFDRFESSRIETTYSIGKTGRATKRFERVFHG